MAKKTVTEVVEIELGAIVSALRDAGYPIVGPPTETVETVTDASGKFGGLRFTYTHEERVKLVTAATK